MLLRRDACGEELVLGVLTESSNGSSWKVGEDFMGEATMLIPCKVLSAGNAPHLP